MSVDSVDTLEGLINDDYVPSSVERKKAVLMYFFVGIVAGLSQTKSSIYESFHLRQSLGRRTIAFIGLVLSLGFIFIPFAWVIPVFFFLLFVVIWIVFVKQAREGRYTIDEDKILMPFFAAFGGRIMEIFEEEEE